MRGVRLLIRLMRSSLTHQEHKKSANPHQAADCSVEIFLFGRSLSRTSTPSGSRHLAVSNDRLPDSVYESLLILETINNEKRRLVNFVHRALRDCAKALKLTRGMIGVLDALSGWERTDLYLVAHLDLPHAAARGDAVEILVELICFLLDSAATAADASIFRKVACTGRIMMVWSGRAISPVLSRRASTSSRKRVHRHRLQPRRGNALPRLLTHRKSHPGCAASPLRFRRAHPVGPRVGSPQVRDQIRSSPSPPGACYAARSAPLLRSALHCVPQSADPAAAQASRNAISSASEPSAETPRSRAASGALPSPRDRHGKPKNASVRSSWATRDQ